jgi:hypothetical protein
LTSHIIGLDDDIIDDIGRHHKRAILRAEHEIAGMDGDVAADDRFVDGSYGAMIKHVAHVTSAAKQREADLAYLGAVASETVDYGTIPLSAHGRLRAELAPDAAIHPIRDKNFAGGQPIDCTKQQFILSARLRCLG